jgi:four helix bundle protein
MSALEDLEVYNRAYHVSLVVHRLSINFPRHEQFKGLASQLRDSSKSMVSNLVEGYSFKRVRPARFKNHLEIGIGSCDETRLWLRYSRDLGYIGESAYGELEREYSEIGKMLWGLYKSSNP